MKANNRIPPTRTYKTVTIIGGVVALLGLQSPAWAQNTASDNFDTGTLDTTSSGWQVRNICQLLGGYVDNSFPDAGTGGKALRLQRGSFDTTPLQQPQQYGTGRAWLFRTNDYDDFYVAMDIVDWNDITNQAIVLLARGTGFDDTLFPGAPPGLGTVNGYVANFDNLQDGDLSGDRFGGEFQINRVVSEGPSTIAAAEVTLIRGHGYRMTFKGVGSSLTAQLYDLEDLMTPIATIVRDDANYPSGKCGIVTFHRDDTTHPNRTDMTVDNYYSGPVDPNADIAPAIRHPVPGTPQVTARTPAARFANFHPAATGIHFTAQIFGTGQINSSATKLFLNGIDFSSTLAPFPANGSTLSFNTAAGTLMANHVYAARIELQDTTGTLKSTNTFWFDTFTDAGIDTAPFKTVECEDYNYSNGVFKLEPIPVSGYETNTGNIVNGYGVGYFDVAFVQDAYTNVVQGTPEIDYHRARTTPEGGWNDYRAMDCVDTMQGIRQEIEDMNHPDLTPPFVGTYDRPNDGPRQKYATVAMAEYEVFRTEVGDWLNYTRKFTDTNYYVFLRCGSYQTQDVQLDLVTSDPTTTGQTTSPLGVFQVQNHLRWGNYRYEYLTDTNGSPVIISLAGTNTLRLTMNGIAPKQNRIVSLNYLLFVPTTGEPPVLTVNKLPSGSISVSWPLIPYVLLTSTSLSNPSWTPVISGVSQAAGKNVYTIASPTGARYFKLVYP